MTGTPRHTVLAEPEFLADRGHPSSAGSGVPLRRHGNLIARGQLAVGLRERHDPIADFGRSDVATSNSVKRALNIEFKR